jgi:hypothetical protein
MPSPFRVEHRDTIVGWFLFHGTDASMGMIVGGFEPGPGYPALAPLFRELTAALSHGVGTPPPHSLFAQRDALALRLVREDGVRIETSWIMIYDYPADQDFFFEANLARWEEVGVYFGNAESGRA